MGGGIGAVAGSQIAARGRRTEGSVIGGVLGAIVGSQVGRASNDQCRSNNTYSNTTYTQAQTYYSPNDRYDDRAYNSGSYYDDRGYRDDRRDYRDDRRDYRRDDRRYENGYEVSPDGRYVYDPRRGWVPR
ncbi:glycine zipper 2TM domain-containing protein [Brevundimonas staleyi]|uniref:17 kDa surface antigen n=1 Tax=Brevundimonas staleyi TaxID=74326 RepID=A0ABW0FSX0_9CAUL